MRRRDAAGVERNRTFAGDLELLVRVAEAGGRVELSVDDDGVYCALIMTAAATSRAYSGHARSLRTAVRRLRDELEQLASAGGERVAAARKGNTSPATRRGRSSTVSTETEPTRPPQPPQPPPDDADED